MRVFEVMSERVQTVKPEMPASEAWELMRRKGIHHLMVMDGPSVVGILSERDAGGRSGSAVRSLRTVADLMTRHVITVKPNDTIRKVANVMRGRTVGCVAVIEDQRLVGILTVSDLLQLLGRGGERRVRPSRPELHWRVPHRKRGRMATAW